MNPQFPIPFRNNTVTIPLADGSVVASQSTFTPLIVYLLGVLSALTPSEPHHFLLKECDIFHSNFVAHSRWPPSSFAYLDCIFSSKEIWNLTLDQY